MADLWLPGAKRVTYPDLSRLPYRSGAKPKLVLHSTETQSGSTRPPGYTKKVRGDQAPQVTYDVTTRTLWQHWPLNVAGRALENESGGQETNREGAVQVELVGTCDPQRRGQKGWLYLPDLTDEQLAHIAEDVIEPVCDLAGIPMTDRGLRWLAYPASYGATSSRMTGAEWRAFSGICGHQHVAENHHGDPGAFPFDRLMRVLEDGVALTSDDAKKVFATDDTVTNPTRTADANPATSAGTALGRIWADTETLKDDVDGLKAAVARIPTTLPPLSSADQDTIAAKVAARLPKPPTATEVAAELIRQLKS